MGRTVRFEQVYVANLEAEPVEDEQLTGIKSILTREIEAEEILLSRLGVSNTSPSKAISVGTKLFIDPDDVIVFDLKERGRASRFFVDNQIAIGTTNPTKTFQINSGEDLKFNIDLLSKDLVTINGNVAVNSNIILTNDLKSSDTGSNLIMGGLNSNVISVKGNVATTNLFVSSNITVGSNIFLSDRGSNVAVMKGNVTVNGGMYVYGNTVITGNLYVAEGIKYERIVNLAITDSTIVFGEGNNGSNEPMLLFTHDENESNIAFGFRTGDRGKEMALFRTEGGPLDTTFTIDDTVSTNLHVFGDIYTSNAVGVANIYPTHDLCVGSNLFVEDIGSNVLEVFGNTFTENLKVGSNVTIGNDVVVIDTTNKDIATINGNVRVHGLLTTGTKSSGISNTLPTDTLSIGTKIYVNLTAANTLTIFGNTMTTNLITQSISSSSNITIHSDRYGDNNLDNPLILKSGPLASNVSSIEIYGASTSNTHQNIRFKTRNHEKMRITSNGQIGINISNPTQKLTVNGNAFVMGSNVMMFGNLWGTTSNTSMQIFSTPNAGENKIENIVDTGKGLNFYASTTATMGTPKLTILESSNVGIGTQTPQSTFHVNGLTSFINNPVTKINGYNHLGTPLVVSNNQPITSTTDLASVLHLAREASGTEHAARATFQLGKHENTSGTSKTRLDIVMGDNDYAVDTRVVTILSSGKVGIGHSQPSAHLEVECEGIADPTENGLLVHNHNSGDAIIAAQTDLANGNAFTSYIQTDGVTLSGWSTGVAGTDGDFRIINNHERVSSNASVGLYISGSSGDVGIGTDVPRGALEVNGNVVIGQQLTFGGLAGDEFGNTHIIERRYTTGQSRTELLLFKGNEASSVDTGPDRIRHIAGEHVFQTYTSSGETLYGSSQILEDMDGQTDKPLVICDNGLVVVGGQRTDANSRGPNTKLVVNGDIEFSGGGAFKLTGFEFSTDDGGFNIIRSLLDGSTRRPLTFVHEIGDLVDAEFARFDVDGRLGLGTSNPTSNIHVYDTTPGNVDIMRLQSIGNDNQTNLLIYTNDDEGGFVRGFSNLDNKTTGLCLGVANAVTGVTSSIHLIDTSNVGVGTPTPGRQFHVVDHRDPALGLTGVVRFESVSSNASIELTTTGGNSNIYADTTGNVYIQPSQFGRPTTFLQSNVEISGDLIVDGIIDFNTIGIGLGAGVVAATDLEVNGGTIVGSGEVSRKTYSKAFSIADGQAKDIQLIFGAGAFYAKVVAMLRRTDGSTTKDLSTMILELQGGSGDEGTPSDIDIAVGTKNLFGGTNSYPWSSTVTTGTRGISIVPYNIDSTRVYSYDISVELMTSSGGKLVKITRDLSAEADLDDGSGGGTQIATFDY